jgi:phosphate transport system permease protein
VIGTAAPDKSRRYAFGRAFELLCLLAISIGMLALVILIADILWRGLGTVNWNFLTSFPSRFPNQAGILAALVGSIWLLFLTALFALPTGIAAAVWLEEISDRRNRLSRLIEVNIANLAGVPSIIYGLMFVGLLVYQLALGTSILAAGLTLGFLVLPIVIVTTREALRTIPRNIREAAYALGATKWQVVWDHLIPYSLGGILTGTIIALSRAIGETAPLIVIGAQGYIGFLPDFPPDAGVLTWLHSKYTVLPIQMYQWINEPDRRFHELAAATGLVLILMTLSLNAVAIVIRYRMRKKIKW